MAEMVLHVKPSPTLHHTKIHSSNQCRGIEVMMFRWAGFVRPSKHHYKLRATQIGSAEFVNDGDCND